MITQSDGCRANLNPEKVEECVIVRCNLRLLKLMGLLETSVHVHLFIYSCSKNDEKMILGFIGIVIQFAGLLILGGVLLLSK